MLIAASLAVDAGAEALHVRPAGAFAASRVEPVEEGAQFGTACGELFVGLLRLHCNRQAGKGGKDR